MPIIKSLLLAIQLSVEVSILLLPVDQEVLLVIYLLPESTDHVDVSFNSALVVVLCAPLLICDSVEVLLQVEELLLQVLVLSLALSQVHGFLPQLSDKPIFMILSCCSIVQLPLWT